MVSISPMIRGMMLAAALALLAVGAAFVLTRITPSTPPSGGEITLLCDDSLRPLMEEVIDAFHRRTGWRVDARFGTPDEMLRDFLDEPGAVHLFLPGDPYYLDQAGGSVAETLPLAWAVPVLLVQGGNPEGFARIAGLSRPGITLGTAGPPSSALGLLAPAVLARHGIAWEEMQPHLQRAGETAAELSAAVGRRAVDAAIVWEPAGRTCLRCELLPLPEEAGLALEVALGLSAAAAGMEAAREFQAFLGGRVARDLLTRHHFLSAPPEPGTSPVWDMEAWGVTEPESGV